MRRTVAYLRGAGVVSLLLAFAALMFLPDYFIGFVVLVYVAIALWGCDLFFETYSSKGGRILVIIALIVVLAGFTFGFVCVKAPIGFAVVDNNVNYAPGTTLGAAPPIPWLNEYDDLDVSVINSTDHDYTDVDLVFKPDLPVAAISQVNGPPCSFSDPTGMSISSLDDIPFPTGEATGVPMAVLATDVGERVRCERVPRRGSVEIIMAVASVNMNEQRTFTNGYVLRATANDGTSHWYRRQDNQLDDSFWKPRTATSSVDVRGSYVVLQRRKYVSKKLYPMGTLIDQIKRQDHIP